MFSCSFCCLLEFHVSDVNTMHLCRMQLLGCWLKAITADTAWQLACSAADAHNNEAALADWLDDVAEQVKVNTRH